MRCIPNLGADLPNIRSHLILEADIIGKTRDETSKF